MTDTAIIEGLLASRGLLPDAIASKVESVRAEMIRYCEEHADKMGVSLLPGIEPLVRSLSSRSDVAMGLVTGNLQPIGWRKLESSGLGGFFSYGGFGGDHSIRGELVLTALRRALAHAPSLPLPAGDWREASPFAGGASAAPEATSGPFPIVYVIGDTPRDLLAAAYAKERLGPLGLEVRGIGVTTGNFTRADLEATAAEGGVAHAILDDLSDTEGVLRLFELA